MSNQYQISTINATFLVNTCTMQKIIFLPTASTVIGGLLTIKDATNNAGRSSILLSTTGLDRIENRFVESTIIYSFLSTNSESITLASDGRVNWMILQNFKPRQNMLPLPPASPFPAYYSSSSGFYMLQIRYDSQNLSLTTAQVGFTTIRTYGSIVDSRSWTVVHDKDLDSNVYYSMGESTRVLYRAVLTKGGTTITNTNLLNYTGATTSVLGACYAPICMWSSPVGYGAFIIGGFSQAVLHVLEFSATKNSIAFTYTVSYTSEVYGTEVIPKAVTGWANDYGVAYTRGSKQMSSWVVNMSTRSWTNRVDNSFSGTPAGSINGCGMIYYPIGKPIFTSDPDTSTHRVGFSDTSSAALYVFNITEGINQINWVYLKTVSGFSGGGGVTPYHMSVNAYNSVV
jgi:hypothetical protein